MKRPPMRCARRSFPTADRFRSNERTRLPPVAFLTTSTEDKDRLNGYRLGANSCVRMPVDFTQFADVGRYWLILNELAGLLGRRRPRLNRDPDQAAFRPE